MIKPKRISPRLARSVMLGLMAVWLAYSAGPALAKRIYRWVDDKGIVHFSDRKPTDASTDVKETLVRAEKQTMVSMQMTGIREAREVQFTNHVAGPVEIALSFSGVDNVGSTPPLPLRVVLSANETRNIARISQQDMSRPASFELAYSSVPGDPGAVPDSSYDYRLPVPDNSGYALHQGFGGKFSHSEPQSFHAVDIAVAEGTDVIAAREGVVMQVEDDFHGAGLDKEKFGGRANHVRVVHADGSMAVYAHLALESVQVTPGVRVRTGQLIGRSGNTGFSTGPHLHFVIQVNRGGELQSIAFSMSGARGAVPIPGS